MESSALINNAITALRKGRLIVYPTDTLYAFGADIFNEQAIKKIFRIKKRPLTNPLPVAVSDIQTMETLASMTKIAEQLATHFLPGPLTLILPKKSIVPDIVTGGHNNIAIRIPNNTIALELLSRYGPLTVTSANIHGVETPGIIKEIKMQFRDRSVAVYLDQGTLKGKPSTIVDVTGEKLQVVREGVIPKSKIAAVIDHG